jgi:hypothetical protein
MTIVRCYPSALGTNNGWSLPARAEKKEDDSCTYLSVALSGTYDLFLNTYKDNGGIGNPFNIPAGATITRETIGIKGGRDTFLGISSLTFYIKYLLSGINNTVGVSAPEFGYSFDCSETTFSGHELDIPSYLWLTIAELNNEQFTTWIEAVFANAGGGGLLAQCDAVYIEVEYTVPSTGVQEIGDGLTFASMPQ